MISLGEVGPTNFLPHGKLDFLGGYKFSQRQLLRRWARCMRMKINYLH